MYVCAYQGGNMSKLMSKRVSAVLIVALAVVLACVMGFTVADGVSMADSNESIANEDSLTIGHMSDIHYFPLEYCYQDVKNANYKQSDFYKSMTGDTKLVLESGLILNKQIQGILQDAREGIAPQYLIASGDLCKNGEHVALIDVANSLRYLQNEVRKLGGKYANFQVFAIVGNHDLYNTDGAVYSQTDGEASVADSVTSAQFALIFAGLGFPNANLTGENGAINLTDYLPEDYWASSYTSGYQASTNAENLKISYYSQQLSAVENETTSQAKLAHYYALGDELHQLTFTAEIVSGNTGYSFAIVDSTDREIVETGAIVRVSEGEYNAISANTNYTYYLENTDGTINQNSPITDVQTIRNAFAQGKNVYRATGRDHYTGGRIKEECLDWIEQFAKTQTGDKTTLGEETVIAVCHQNVLPHWDQEDEILKDFTLYNWEYVAKRMLGMGIRYVLTGHMHASDIMNYTDVEGRTLYDFETGSCVSFSSPRRYITITRENCDGKLGEQCSSSVYSIENIKEVASDNIFACRAWDQAAFDSAMATYKAAPTSDNWQAVVNSNPEYLTYIIQYDDLSVLTLEEFMNKDIYSILLDRMVSHFVNQDTIDSLKDTVQKLLLGDNTVVNMVAGLIAGSKSALNGLAQYLIDTVLYDLYPDTNGDGKADYPYNGNTYDSALDYLLAIVEDVLALKFGDENIQSAVNPTNAGKLNVKEIASFIMTAHGAGLEISLDETYASIDEQYVEKACGDNHFAYQLPTDKTYRKRMLAAVKDMHAQLVSGEFVENLLDMLLNPLFVDNDSLLKTLLGRSFDFNDAVDKGYITQDEYDTIETQLADLPALLNNGFVQAILKGLGIELSLPEDFSIPADDFIVGGIINNLLPALKPIVANLIGFNLEGTDIVEIIQGVLDDYLTKSFYVGLGGIADGIVIAFATDEVQDLADNTNPSLPLIVQARKDYKYADVKLTYLSSLNAVSSVNSQSNPATQDNGRVPSRVTANFDTKNGVSDYVVKFYTEENVYGTFRLFDKDGNAILEVSTSQAAALEKYASDPTDYMDITATQSAGNITVSMLTQTKPVYLPLIDLGLLCLTHGEVEYDTEDAKDVPYVYGQRDEADANSVIYWNVTTVRISGLNANTTYKYDVSGNYESSTGAALTFSLAEFSKAQGSDSDLFTLKTAADDSVTEFEFLTIADIQGMIQGMYDDSVKAVDALLKDERTNKFDFVLNAGDMCDNGKNFNQWGMALNTYQDLFANTSMFFAAGNHEDGSNAMARYFEYTLPVDSEGNRLQNDVTNGMFYSFDYANAHFTVLDTNDADSNGLGEVQLEWLKQDLAGSNAKWKFVLMHKSLFSGGSHSTDAEVVAMRSQLVPIFAQNGVNMVFAGHDHTYTSTYLVDEKGKTTDKSDLDGVQYTGDGVLYITLGTLGTKFYEYGENPDVTPKFDGDKSILETLTSQTFGKVTVSGDTLTYTGYIYNRETDSIEEIGISVISANKVLYKSVVIALSVCIPVVVIGIVIATLLILKKQGKLGKRKDMQANE